MVAVRSVVLLAVAAFLATSQSARCDDLDAICGKYQRKPVENDWHTGVISRKDAGKLEWKNKAGVAWNLFPDLKQGLLRTDETNPYFKDGRRQFTLMYRAGKLVGFRFGDESYLREGAPAIRAQKSFGLHGYIGVHLDPPPPEFLYGYSFYSTAIHLLDKPVRGFQIGMAGTWITPENSAFKGSLLWPEARQRWAKLGRENDHGIFQTIEGSLGFWASTRFPMAAPKYRMNSTPDAYEHELSSPGWGFGQPEALDESVLGMAQLSNRLLVPPDGLTFDAPPQGEIMGFAWLTLPLVPEERTDAALTGDESWTFFANSANFAGPVAFYVPDAFSRMSRTYKPIRGRGLDSRPGTIGGIAIEIGAVPCFEETGRDGTTYRRIPKISFPVNDARQTMLAQDVFAYSKRALFDGVKSFKQTGRLVSGTFARTGSRALKMKAEKTRFDQGEKNTPIDRMDAVLAETVFVKAPATTFGLQWGNQLPAGQLPEYFAQLNGKIVPVPAATVPAELGLAAREFDPPQQPVAYTSPSNANSVWKTPGPKAGPFEATLKDGSVVTYAWYRFADQPTIVAQKWTTEKRDRLQKLVEQIHTRWPINGQYMPPPARGTLVTLDRALIVTPPAGLEVGYVPIVTGQRPGK